MTRNMRIQLVRNVTICMTAKFTFTFLRVCGRASDCASEFFECPVFLDFVFFLKIFNTPDFFKCPIFSGCHVFCNSSEPNFLNVLFFSNSLFFLGCPGMIFFFESPMFSGFHVFPEILGNPECFECPVFENCHTIFKLPDSFEFLE